MSFLAATALVAGRLVAAGLACGLNLYATIALIGLGSRFGWIELPPGLVGLEQWLLITAAGLLFAAEFVAATMPVVDSIWEAAHTVIRPVGAGVLAVTVLEPAPWPVRIAGGLLATAAAFASHSAKVGLRLVVTRRRSTRLVVSALEDLAAAALAVLALAWPWAAAAAGAIFVLALVVAGPRLWRASTFGVRASVAFGRGFFGGRGWLSTGDLPAAIRQRVPPPELGAAEPRAVRAALDSNATGRFRNGWLVVDGRTAVFYYRKSLRTFEFRLPRPDDPNTRHRMLSDTIAWSAGGQRYVLHLLRDGPQAEIVTGTLQATVI